MSQSRMIFLDVDGTLIDHSQRLAPSVVEAVRTARAAGHLAFICTGRARRELPASVVEIGFDGVVSAGGGFAEIGDELVHARTMPPAAVERLTSYFDEINVEYNMQGYDDIYPSRGLFDRVAPMILNDTNRDAAASRDMNAFAERMRYRGAPPTDGVAKATFFGTEPTTFARVRDGLGEDFHVITGTIPYLGSAGGEVSLSGVHKGAAIAAVAAHLGRPMSETIGIGDSYNDLEMLSMAGVGIAMGNADDTVKSYADVVTTSVEDDGVYNAFRAQGLI